MAAPPNALNWDAVEAEIKFAGLPAEIKTYISKFLEEKDKASLALVDTSSHAVVSKDVWHIYVRKKLEDIRDRYRYRVEDAHKPVGGGEVGPEWNIIDENQKFVTFVFLSWLGPAYLVQSSCLTDSFFDGLRMVTLLYLLLYNKGNEVEVKDFKLFRDQAYQRSKTGLIYKLDNLFITGFSLITFQTENIKESGPVAWMQDRQLVIDGKTPVTSCWMNILLNKVVDGVTEYCREMKKVDEIPNISSPFIGFKKVEGVTYKSIVTLPAGTS